MKIYEALAKVFHTLDLGTCFALLGDANMHWAGALSDLGARFIYTRHEHAAVAAATAYARNSGKLGFATVTCGPGLTQVMTILPIAVRARVPLVLFAGEAPLHKEWYNQMIDQAPFVQACGAHYVPLHDPETIIQDAINAVQHATQKRMPVVLGVPFDLQKQDFSGDFSNLKGTFKFPKLDDVHPKDNAIQSVAALLQNTEKTIIFAGMGATSDYARKLIVELADVTGSLLATTLPAKGLFHDQIFCLGVAGGYASDAAKDIFARAEVVLGIGARMASHTFDGGRLTPKAKVIQIDLEPQEQVQGRRASDVQITSDAISGARALLNACKGQPAKTWRTAAMEVESAAALTLPQYTPPTDGFLHPLAVIETLQQEIPKTTHIINTSGHCAYYTAQMNAHPQSHYTVIRDFGAIGNGTSFALGIAERYPDRPVILLDGDGSVMMHIQELETMARHGLNIMTVVLNDGGYGSEVHKLRASGATLAGSVFGRPDFASVGRGFGLAGTTATTQDDIAQSVRAFLNSDEPAICDVHISDTIASPQIQRIKH
jgi:thiamine pyrophosphate-dependent acetolactate synthase large subunit-like protein